MDNDNRSGSSKPTGAAVASTPLSVITGFLGSGKTTTLSRLLADPRMSKAAVIINEFGEIGLDHLLVTRPREDVILLANGCLCCTVRGDLVDTLSGLFVDRARGKIMDFDRILVETTGLADPLPVLRTAHSDPELGGLLHLENVITTVDAVHGLGQIGSHPESVKQICTADTVLITKTDLAERGQIEQLRAVVGEINPGVEMIEVVHGEVPPQRLFDSLNPTTLGMARLPRWLTASGAMTDHSQPPPAHGHHYHAHHREGVHSFTLTFDKPITAAGLQIWTQLLGDFRGADLLRIKGIVNIEGRPYVLQAVQHLVHPLTELPEWPSADHRSRLIFITRNILQSDIERTLHALQFDLARQSGTGFDVEGFRRFSELAGRFRQSA
jgi:G3E family GTPase